MLCFQTEGAVWCLAAYVVFDVTHLFINLVHRSLCRSILPWVLLKPAAKMSLD